MSENGIVNLGDVLSNALSGVELTDEPVELSEKQLQKLEQQRRRQEEAAAREAARKAEAIKLAEVRDARRKESLKKALADYKTSPEDSLAPVNGTSEISTWRDYREKGVELWTIIGNRLTNPEFCTDDALSVVHPEKFIRGYANNQKFLFHNEVPVRPSFFIADKMNPAVKYPAWLSFPEGTVQVEFGSRIPMIYSKEEGKKIRNPNGIEVPFFSISVLKYENGKLNFLRDVFAFESFAGEFVPLATTMKIFFSKITPTSKKKFNQLKYILENNVPGIFDRGRTEPEIHQLLTAFLREGGSGDDFDTIYLKRNEVAVFAGDAGYILVNTSHRKAGLIDPEKCVADGITGFTRGPDGKISTFLPQQMSVVELKGTRMTIVHGA